MNILKYAWIMHMKYLGYIFGFWIETFSPSVCLYFLFFMTFRLAKQEKSFVGLYLREHKWHYSFNLYVCILLYRNLWN